MNVQIHEFQEYETEAKQNKPKCNRTKLDNMTLHDTLDAITEIEGVVRDIMTNKETLIESCCKRRLNYKYVRHLLLSNAFTYCRASRPSLPLADTLVLEPDGFEQMYIEVFHIKDLSSVELPPDFRQTAMDVLDVLDDKEKKVMCLRYGLGEYDLPKPLEKVAVWMNLTPSMVKQVLDNSIRKLQHPLIKEWMSEGSARFRAKQVTFENGTDLFEHEFYLQDNEQSKENELRSIQQPDQDLQNEPLSAGIEWMDLSPRVYNCLKRAGKNTVKDVFDMTEKELNKIRGLGCKGIAEICEKRNDYGEIIDSID